MLRRCLPVAIVLLVAAAPLCGQAPLKWQWKVNDNVYLEIVSNTKEVVNAQLGKEVKLDVDQTFLIGFTVKELTPDGGIVAEGKIENWKVTGKANPVDKIIEQVQGAVFKMTFNGKMEMIKFEGYEDMVKRIAGEDVLVRKVLEKTFPPDTMKKFMSEGLAFLPDKQENKWEKKFNDDLGPLGILTRTTQYKYEGKVKVDNKDLEKITFSATGTYAPPKPEENKDLAFRIIKGKVDIQKLEGTIFFDPIAGRLDHAEQRKIVKGDLTMSISNNQVETSLQLEDTTRIRLLDKKP